MKRADDFFGTVPPTNHLGLLGRRPDLKKTVALLDLERNDVATATGVPPRSIRYDDRGPEAVRVPLTEIATACEMVADFFEGDVTRTALWFRLPNPAFGNISPRDMIRIGRYRRVVTFVRAARQAERNARSR